MTESPIKVPASSDAEVGGLSQSEDERGSFFSELHENIDVITEALREDAETEVLEDEDIKMEETVSSEKGSHSKQ